MATNNEYEVEEHDVEYRRLAGMPWLARVYPPKGAGPFPTIFDVHGGAWQHGDRLNNAGVDRALAARGVVVAAIDFRQPPEADYPASLGDVNLAIRWLKAHAGEFHGTTKVGAFGNSSDGHQVVLSGLRPRHPAYSTAPLDGSSQFDASVAYAIAAWPVICPLYRFQYAKRIANQHHVQAHIDYWATEAAMSEGSPQTIIDSDESVELPALLFLLKANDKNHPLEMQQRFIASYQKRGGAIAVHSFDGLPEHRMVPSASQPDSMRFIEMVSRFIQTQTK